jgi:hypothetical protein
VKDDEWKAECDHCPWTAGPFRSPEVALEEVAIHHVKEHPNEIAPNLLHRPDVLERALAKIAMRRRKR